MSTGSSRPLLVLHGTADVNVPFLDSVRLIDALLQAGKDVSTSSMYPGEFHYFQRAHVLRDAWTRAERFLRSPYNDGDCLGRRMPLVVIISGRVIKA